MPYTRLYFAIDCKMELRSAINYALECIRKGTLELKREQLEAVQSIYKGQDTLSAPLCNRVVAVAVDDAHCVSKCPCSSLANYVYLHYID